KTILSKQEFALREVLALLGNAYLLGRRIQIQERLADVLVYATRKIGNLIVDAPDAARKLLGLAVAVAIEDREIDLALNQAGGLHAADAAAQFANVSIEAKFWIEAGAAGALLFDEALTLAGEGKIIGPGLEPFGPQCLRLRLSKGLVTERLGEFKRGGRIHAKISRQGKQRLLQPVLSDQQGLFVVSKLHLSTQYVHARRCAGIVLVIGQLEQSA